MKSYLILSSPRGVELPYPGSHGILDDNSKEGSASL